MRVYELNQGEDIYNSREVREKRRWRWDTKQEIWINNIVRT